MKSSKVNVTYLVELAVLIASFVVGTAVSILVAKLVNRTKAA